MASCLESAGPLLPSCGDLPPLRPSRRHDLGMPEVRGDRREGPVHREPAASGLPFADRILEALVAGKTRADRGRGLGRRARLPCAALPAPPRPTPPQTAPPPRSTTA